MTTSTRRADRRLWFVTLAAIVAILVVNYIVWGPSHPSSPIVMRLAAAAIVTPFVVAAKIAAGPKAAAVTGVVGVLIAVVVLDWLA